MKALSIKQPWAHLIIHGGKDIENRKWSTKFRGRFLVHASKEIDEEAMIAYVQMGLVREHCVTGAIIGSVEIIDCVTESESPWFQGPYGFVLRNPLIKIPVPLKGQLKFFEAGEV